MPPAVALDESLSMALAGAPGAPSCDGPLVGAVARSSLGLNTSGLDRSLFTKRSADGSTQYGLTPPFSTAAPMDLDVQCSSKLVAVLEDASFFEDLAATAGRHALLEQMRAIVNDWALDHMPPHALPKLSPEGCFALLLPFGSYRLGVHAAGADIDCVCVCTRDVAPHMFFDSFPEHLRSLEQSGKGVQQVKCVADAYVPVIKFKFGGVDFDMLFAQLPQDSLPASLNLFDDALLQGMDIKSIRSLNGVRVTEMLLKIVPHVENFRAALRAIKL